MSRDPLETEKDASASHLAEDDETREVETLRRDHGPLLAGGVYGNALRARLSSLLVGPDPEGDAIDFVEDLIRRMAPRDPAEEMLVVQLLMTHVRVLHLTDLANRQERLDSVRTVHEYADRASNTYRRLMLALAEYRRPPRSGDSFTAIRQTNIAQQQVVANGETLPTGNATNGQGSNGGGSGGQALPAEPRGARGASGVRAAGEAVAAVNGASD